MPEPSSPFRFSPAKSFAAERLMRSWVSALKKPSQELLIVAGIIANREKYRKRAAGYLYRFYKALVTCKTTSEAFELAVEGGLLPSRNGDIGLASCLWKKILGGNVTRDNLHPLQVAFQIFWKTERRRVARANRKMRKIDFAPSRKGARRKSRASTEAL